MTVRTRLELNNGYRKMRSGKGMTMAEMLVTVAILMILMGVIFVGLINYQKLMAQSERDGYAKQIFIAAQNHLTMARGEGYLGVADNLNRSSTASDTEKEKVKEVLGNPAGSGKYYFVVNKGSAFTGSGGSKTTSIIDQMLPFGAVDETIRLGGSYIIEYDPDTATVFNVFYCSTNTGKFDHELTADEYKSTTGFKDYVDKYDDNGNVTTNNKAKRRNEFHDGKILGWYGGADLDTLDVPLKAPTVTVDNGDVLKVTIKDNNPLSGDTATFGEIKLFITGKTNGARRAIYIKAHGNNTAGTQSIANDTSTGGRLDNSKGVSNGEYVYTLDDITSRNNHFCNLGGDSSGNMIAGDDIEIRAVSYSTQKLANIAYSDPVETNSLYEEIAKPEDADNNTTYDEKDRYAYVSSIRHLENLDASLSKAGCDMKSGDPDLRNKRLNIVRAYQTDDLNWDAFKDSTKGAATEVHTYNGASWGGFYPVNTLGESLTYDGLRHSVSGITVNLTNNGDYASWGAGMFGSYGADGSASAIKNLRLKNFDINGDGHTGALAGIIQNTNVYNVIAYNTERGNITTATVAGGSAGGTGGLVGTMSAGSSMKYCGAALVVSSGSGSGVGGLIGSISGSAKITACFSAGHTDKGTYFEDGEIGNARKAIYNVSMSSNGTAGGLVGEADNATITNCYSTCSVSTGAGGNAGGLVGASTGNIINCYSTGLVSGDHAFIGDNKTSQISGCKYLEIINEVKESNGYSYKATGASDAAVTPIDDDAGAYEKYVSGRSNWNRSFPYDPVLRKYYHLGNSKYLYNFKTVTQLEQSAKTSKESKKLNKKSSLFVNSHYGDWPAPEQFIINGSGSGSASDNEMWGTVTGVTGIVPSDNTIMFTYNGVEFSGKMSHDWSSVTFPVNGTVNANTLASYNGKKYFFKAQKTASNTSAKDLFGDETSVIPIPDRIRVLDKKAFDDRADNNKITPENMDKQTVVYVDAANHKIFLRTANVELTYPTSSSSGWTEVTDSFPDVDWAAVSAGPSDEDSYNTQGYNLKLVGSGKDSAGKDYKQYQLSLKNITGEKKASLNVTMNKKGSGSIETIGGHVSGTINADNTVTITFNNWGSPIQIDQEFVGLYLMVTGTGDFSLE